MRVSWWSTGLGLEVSWGCMTDWVVYRSRMRVSLWYMVDLQCAGLGLEYHDGI